MKNEKGYALVTVLLMIVVFMVISLSFMGQSFNSVKQNKVVETNYQSVALAEMGVSYYRLAIRNAYLTNQSAVMTQVDYMVKTNSNNGVKRSNDYYLQQTISLMKQAIQSSLDSEKSIVEMDQSETAFKIDDVIISSEIDSSEITIDFTSKGMKDEEESNLKAQMVIPINSIDISNDAGGGTSTSNELPDFDDIPKPEGVSSECRSASVIYSSCEQVLVEGSADFDGNGNGLGGKLIYTTGSLVLSGNYNKMDNMKIHSDGSFSIMKNMNSAKNVIIESKDATSFGGQLRMDSSKLYSAGIMSVDDHLTLSNNSFTYVGGSASITKHLTISTNSKMCVAGDLEASQLKIYGNLFVKGSVKGKLMSGQPVYVNDSDFVKNCGSASSSDVLTIEWGDTKDRVDYQY